MRLVVLRVPDKQIHAVCFASLLLICGFYYRGNSQMLIPYFSLISNTSSIAISKSLTVTHWICIQLCHMGKRISKTSPGQERYPGLEGLRKCYPLSMVICRKGEMLSKAYAMIYSRFSSKMGSCFVSEEWLRHYVDIRFALGSEAMPSQWLDFVCVSESESVCKQITVLTGIPCCVLYSAHLTDGCSDSTKSTLMWSSSIR